MRMISERLATKLNMSSANMRQFDDVFPAHFVKGYYDMGEAIVAMRRYQKDFGGMRFEDFSWLSFDITFFDIKKSEWVFVLDNTYPKNYNGVCCFNIHCFFKTEEEAIMMKMKL